jgi:HSP20 family protein
MNTTRLPSLFAAEPFALDDAFRTFMRPYRWEAAPEVPPMKLDISEVDDVYVVKAEIPGVAKQDIHVEIEGTQVLITAEVKKELDTKMAGRVLRTERSYGVASRMFALPFELDRAKAVAKYEAGVLTLTLPKKVTAHTEPLIVQ